MANPLEQLAERMGMNRPERPPTRSIFTPEQIAEVAHNAVAAYQAAVGALIPTVPWIALPAEGKTAALAMARRIMLAADLGKDEQSPPHSHDHWLEASLRDGWRYGPKHDRELKTSPLLLPWHALGDREQLTHFIFHNVARTMLCVRVPDSENQDA